MSSNRFKRSVDKIVENTENNTKYDASRNAIENENDKPMYTSRRNAIRNEFREEIENARDNVKDDRIYNETYNAKSNAIYNEKENAIENAKCNEIDSAKKNILEKVLVKNKKDRGVSHTLYLSADVSAELSRLAKKHKQSRSTLVDDILRAVIFED